MKNYLIGIILLTITTTALAQGSGSLNLKEAYRQDVKIRKTGMLILGSWAAANIISGGIGRSRLTGEQAYFHEMNLIWNVVNLSIAGAGYYFTLTGNSPENAAALLSDQVSFQKTLLFNAGLDIAYIVGGLYLIEKAKNTVNKPERLRGYGKSIILQGSFLLVFDIILHTIHQKETAQIPDFLSKLYITPQELGLVINF